MLARREMVKSSTRYTHGETIVEVAYWAAVKKRVREGERERERERETER